MPEKIFPAEVISMFMTDKISLMGTGFMMRSAHYDKSGGIPPYPKLLFADMELFIKLSLLGYMAVASEECFSYRIHASATTSVSSDKAFVEGFGNLVSFLESLKKISPEIDNIVSHNADFILRTYCQGISHKILKTPKSNRETPSVGQIIEQFRIYGKRLKGNDLFNPLSYRKIRLGKVIDETPLYYHLFQLLKKIYKKPIFS